jgi:hypothetical protein
VGVDLGLLSSWRRSAIAWNATDAGTGRSDSLRRTGHPRSGVPSCSRRCGPCSRHKAYVLLPERHCQHNIQSCKTHTTNRGAGFIRAELNRAEHSDVLNCTTGYVGTYLCLGASCTPYFDDHMLMKSCPPASSSNSSSRVSAAGFLAAARSRCTGVCACRAVRSVERDEDQQARTSVPSHSQRPWRYACDG